MNAALTGFREGAGVDSFFGTERRDGRRYCRAVGGRRLGWPPEQPVLRGDGITLRGWRPADADAVFEACQDPAIQRWTTVPAPYLPQHAAGFVNETAPGRWADGEGASFCVAGDGGVLGACGLVAIDHARLIGEVGYWIGPRARGAGVAERAVRRLGEWALTEGGLDRLELYIEPENVASTRVAERVGCEREGLLRSKALVRGQRRDVLLYALVR